MALTITFIAPPPRGPCHLYQARIDPTLLPSLTFFFFFSTACTNRVTQPLSFVKRYSDPWNRYPYITKFPTSTAPRHGTRKASHTKSYTQHTYYICTTQPRFLFANGYIDQCFFFATLHWHRTVWTEFFSDFTLHDRPRSRYYVHTPPPAPCHA